MLLEFLFDPRIEAVRNIIADERADLFAGPIGQGLVPRFFLFCHREFCPCATPVNAPVAQPFCRAGTGGHGATGSSRLRLKVLEYRRFQYRTTPRDRSARQRSCPM